MSWQFLIHIIISSCIFALMASGFRFFVKLKGTIDFSYLGLIIFGTYATVLLHLHLGRGMLLSMCVAFVLSLFFTVFILFLSARLQDIYFAAGTLAFYLLINQLSYNLDNVTGGSLGLSGIDRVVFATWSIGSLEGYFLLMIVVVLCVMILLFVFARSYLYTMLQAWGENILIVRSLGIRIHYIKLVLIVLTTFLAVLGGGLYAFYYQFIDPGAFWIGLVVLLLAIVFLSYNMSYIGLFGVSFVLTLVYEYLRFFKIFDAGDIWYIREGLFALIVMVAARAVFRRWLFHRNQ